MDKHTPEPWSEDGYRVHSGDSMLMEAKHLGDYNPYDLSRAVSCVNALQGVSDPAAFMAAVQVAVAIYQDVGDLIPWMEPIVKSLSSARNGGGK